MKAATGSLHGMNEEMNQPKYSREHFAIMTDSLCLTIRVEKSKFTFSYAFSCDSRNVSEPFDHCFTFKYYIDEYILKKS